MDFYFIKTSKCSHSSPIIQHNSQFLHLNLFELVVVVGMGMLCHHGKCHRLHIQKKNSHNKELKHNQTQPNSTELMTFFGRIRANQKSRSNQLLENLSTNTGWQRCSVRTTFLMKVTRSRGPGVLLGTQAADEIQSSHPVLVLHQNNSLISASTVQIVLQLRIMFSLTLINQSHSHQESIALCLFFKCFLRAPLLNLFSFLGRFSHRRSFVPADTALRPFL